MDWTVRGESVDRGMEIQDWLDKNGDTVEGFVILDDDSDMAHLMDRLVHLDGETGLTSEAVEEASKILNRRWIKSTF